MRNCCIPIAKIIMYVVDIVACGLLPVFIVIFICSNVSPTLDETRERGFPNGSSKDDSSSSSDEEVKKSLVVEISPLVTYAGEVSLPVYRLHLTGTGSIVELLLYD